MTAASGSAAGISAVSPSTRSNADVIYICDTALYRSTDGGQHFVPVKGAPGGDDYQNALDQPG